MEVEELARELVGIPSHDDETEAGDYIQAWLDDETDSEVTRDGIGNVIARRNENADDETLAFVGHHDVVPPAESQVEDGYVVEKRDGRLYGRGTADMKGALAAAMLAFRDAEPSDELVFASFVGEEQGGVGARHAVDAGFTPDNAVVIEGSTGYSGPENIDVAVAHKGRREWEVTARGTSAHASEIDEGDNAIYRAADAVDEVRRAEFPTTEVRGNEMEGSVAVTEIQGGTAGNVVPDRCVFTVDERTLPRQRGLDGFDADVEAEVTSEVPAMVCDDDEFVERVLGAARKHGESEAVVKPHATDAGWLSRAGTDCVVCGPAEPGEAHTADESVSVEVLERCYAVYRDVV